MESKKIASKGMVLIFIFCSFLLFSRGAQAQYQTNLLPGVYIQSSGSDIDVGSWSAPLVYDWDSDGLNDLLVGRKGADNTAYVSFYKNQGTEASPLFNGYNDIMTCSDPCTIGGG
jgi:hypothetical protein